MNVKHNITYFYSEGMPNDNGKDLKYCKETLLTNSKSFDNVSFYTPKILSELGYNNFSTNEQSIAGTIIANWVKKRKYNIPLNYPIIGFQGRDINKIIYFNNYDYLKYLQN